MKGTKILADALSLAKVHASHVHLVRKQVAEVTPSTVNPLDILGASIGTGHTLERPIGVQGTVQDLRTASPTPSG